MDFFNLIARISIKTMGTIIYYCAITINDVCFIFRVDYLLFLTVKPQLVFQ